MYRIYVFKNRFNNFELEQITKIKRTQFTGSEPLNASQNMKIKLNFSHDIERFYIYFENTHDKIIYKEKPFEKISFLADGNEILEFDYENLLYEMVNSNENKTLPKGVYEIEWKNIINYEPNNLILKLNGLIIPNNYCVNIYAESYNCAVYKKGICELLFQL